MDINIFHVLKDIQEFHMRSKKFLMNGNICGDRIRLARAMRKPAYVQEDPARTINLMGMDMTKLIISRIEKGL